MNAIKYIVGLTLATGVAIVFVQYMSIPVVVISHSTGQCVKIISAQGEGNCANLPDKYIKEWSE